MSRSELRVAVIEDDADIAFTVRVNLEREGYVVTTYQNGHEGLLAVQQGGLDFLILDLNRPFDGLIRVSDDALRAALSRLGR